MVRDNLTLLEYGELWILEILWEIEAYWPQMSVQAFWSYYIACFISSDRTIIARSWVIPVISKSVTFKSNIPISALI